MNSHVETELIPYLRGELAAADRERVAQHLAGCAACQRQLDDTREILLALRAQAPQPPEPDWRRYRAELRGKLEERSTRRWSWSLPRLVPVAATAAVAGLALVFTLRAVLPHSSGDDDAVPFEQTEIASHLELLQNYSLVENLDLLDDLEVVQHLDDLDDSSPANEA